MVLDLYEKYQNNITGEIVVLISLDNKLNTVEYIYENSTPFNPIFESISTFKKEYHLIHPEISKESTPDGKSANEAGAKMDAGKNRLGLVLGGFALALEQVGKVGTIGAEKYSPNGWKKVEDGIARYTDAMQRHWLAENKGEKLDTDLTNRANENIYHAACVAWNALARLNLMLDQEKQEKANDSIS